jgi:hypothetical protein
VDVARSAHASAFLRACLAATAWVLSSARVMAPATVWLLEPCQWRGPASTRTIVGADGAWASRQLRRRLTFKRGSVCPHLVYIQPPPTLPWEIAARSARRNTTPRSGPLAPRRIRKPRATAGGTHPTVVRGEPAGPLAGYGHADWWLVPQPPPSRCRTRNDNNNMKSTIVDSSSHRIYAMIWPLPLLLQLVHLQEVGVRPAPPRGLPRLRGLLHSGVSCMLQRRAGGGGGGGGRG